ncbi:MAG: hypothetical protein B6A08_12485 [Sorangiineae bacterium NIC37A_2]|nr:MAG: hypothetical protein B6A08_12485 [Sorangiineae bacterium NIC37A_2]
MPHKIEPAPSGRAKCRSCKKTIEKGSLRLGASVPNAFGDGESFHWFHLVCGAERRSAEFLEALADPESTQPEPAALEELKALAAIGVEHPRWTRPAHVERATTGRAKCRHCREAIAAGSLRIALEFVEDGMINPSGFLHPTCALAYLGSTEHILERMIRSSELNDEEVAELQGALSSSSV